MATSLLADKRFWACAAERAVLTFAQALVAELAVFKVADIERLKLHGLPWYAMISVAVIAALVSLLTTISKGVNGSAGTGVDLKAETVEEPYAHDDVPPAESIMEPDGDEEGPVEEKANKKDANKKK